MISVTDLPQLSCTAGSVSYTHLDVYKRQIGGNIPVLCFKIYPAFYPHGFGGFQFVMVV